MSGPVADGDRGDDGAVAGHLRPNSLSGGVRCMPTDDRNNMIVASGNPAHATSGRRCVGHHPGGLQPPAVAGHDCGCVRLLPGGGLLGCELESVNDGPVVALLKPHGRRGADLLKAGNIPARVLQVAQRPARATVEFQIPGRYREHLTDDGPVAGPAPAACAGRNVLRIARQASLPLRRLPSVKSGAGWKHRSGAMVDRVDDLAAVDPLQVDRRDPQVGVPPVASG